MPNVSKYSVAEATRLKNTGHSHQEIAAILGCSVHWCNKALVGIEKGIGISVDSTKQQAISILEEALAKVRAL